MTSFILRSASPAKTKVDAVVVGVVAQDSGVDLAPGGEEVGKAYGRKLRPLLSSLSLRARAPPLPLASRGVPTAD